MNKNQFNILASKMRANALKDAARLVLVEKDLQCDAAKLCKVSRQNLSQAIKRLKKREAEFAAMREVM